MPDDPKNRGKADRTRVNIHQGHERFYWAGRFGCTQKRLAEAVKEVGVMVEDVRRELIKRIKEA